ncbi:MAG: molybdopterin-guanine dinucleotide biosynthesis protein B [Alphaproteobacteria bacterium]|nr:molybdopterin-guanine dinucleotide biosynthesis protein B [Alphaproteobacteria bacterium]
MGRVAGGKVAGGKVMGIVGWSGSGKTNLIVRLLPHLAGRGLVVSTIKHAHHDFDVDQPGKDSYEHRLAGAGEVLIASAHRWALMHEHRGQPEPSIAALMAHMSPVDLVLVEGFKRERHPKIEVRRSGVIHAPLWPDHSSVVAIAADAAMAASEGPAPDRPLFDLDDTAAIATFIIGHLQLRAAP